MAKKRRVPQAVGLRSRRRPRTASVPRPTRRPRASATLTHPVVTIRFDDGDGVASASVRRDLRLVQLARDWAYILRSRARWSDDEDIRDTYRARALSDLSTLGLTRSDLQRMASCQHVEVELHAWDPGDEAANTVHEAASEFPWEYLLSAATRGTGRHQAMLVTRLFRNSAPAVIPPPPSRVLFIESAPGRIPYDFTSERRRISAAVGADGDQASGAGSREIEFSATESVRELKRHVRRGAWDVLHVTGVDTHQAAWEVPDFYEAPPPSWKPVFGQSGEVRDGMVLREVNVAELPVPYDELAKALVDTRQPPSLVTLNLYYSGARTAREIVARGANSALGFLDEIDDDLAERFFQEFYWAWCRPSAGAPSPADRSDIPTIPKAFVRAWQKMPGHGLHGTSIVIWMGRSVFDKFRVPQATAAAAPVEPIGPERLATRPIGDLLQVEVEAEDEVNYSLLHNDRPLLTKLTLTKLVKEPLHDIGVLVELNLGTQNYPFRCTQVVLDAPQLALADSVRIPLTATLPRSLRERVRSTVYTRVTCGGRVAHETTRRVTLIPVDEWVDDTDENPWLPSFVLPRDPAIQAVIGSSRRYLVALADDPAAGFDGYQAIDPDAEDPTAGIDAQVQAIWTALVNEYRLQYINPPPSYSDQSQRLRMPSDILASNSATCIDLALLLASCLEYIDIYPVVVLLDGHAFAGYWRSDTAHDAFVEVQHIPAEVPSIGGRVGRESAVRFVDQYGWRLTRLHYEEIMQYVTSGDLVMLEATYLTSASSFAEAIEEGRANMRSRREFDSLLDIRLARSASPPVTPLPVISA